MFKETHVFSGIYPGKTYEDIKIMKKDLIEAFFRRLSI